MRKTFEFKPAPAAPERPFNRQVMINRAQEKFGRALDPEIARRLSRQIGELSEILTETLLEGKEH